MPNAGDHADTATPTVPRDLHPWPIAVPGWKFAASAPRHHAIGHTANLAMANDRRAPGLASGAGWTRKRSSERLPTQLPTPTLVATAMDASLSRRTTSATSILRAATRTQRRLLRTTVVATRIGIVSLFLTAAVVAHHCAFPYLNRVHETAAVETTIATRPERVALHTHLLLQTRGRVPPKNATRRTRPRVSIVFASLQRSPPSVAIC